MLKYKVNEKKNITQVQHPFILKSFKLLCTIDKLSKLSPCLSIVFPICLFSFSFACYECQLELLLGQSLESL